MRSQEILKSLTQKVKNYSGKPIRIMEVCGTHTHENFRLGIRSILPSGIRLISGPGCPVCVTPVSYIDKAVEIAKKGAVVCTFGDLLRVPGSGGSLYDARALGGRVKMVYSPFDALRFAADNPGEEVVFLSVGFETTTPVICAAALKAYRDGTANFSILAANKTMDNVYQNLAGYTDAFLYPGHVSAITGTSLYGKLKEDGISGVVAGFTALELVSAVSVIADMCSKDAPFFVNCYPRVVRREGNPAAREAVQKMMIPCDAVWRGFGNIKDSGLKLKDRYESVDAGKKFDVSEIYAEEPAGCRCGDVLRGKIEPNECSLYKKRCTPENPCGACMVSSEGACAAYYKYGEV